MSNRILVNPSTPEGAALLECSDLIAKAQAAVTRLNNAVGAMAYGSPADYAAVQTELGVSTLQSATDLVFLLQSAATAINAAGLTEFVQRTDQG